MRPPYARLIISVLTICLTQGCVLFERAGVLEEADCINDPLGRGDGLDNDGDGVVDEGCVCAFEQVEVGVCITGVVGEEGGLCQKPANYYAVEAYLCDGLDNDCDGQIDEGCRCQSGGSNVGVCALGRVQDIDGACMDSELLQATESICDGYDNDCDGATDEDCALCEVNGSSQGACAFGLLGKDGTCKPPLAYLEDEAIQCAQDALAGDLIDNDCDGVIDEGCACAFAGSMIGVCSLGRRSERGCDPPSLYEITETSCDGADNDCDGMIDEGCEEASEEGSLMPPACSMRREMCNGVDDNCNGLIDEGCAQPMDMPPDLDMGALDMAPDGGQEDMGSDMPEDTPEDMPSVDMDPGPPSLAPVKITFCPMGILCPTFTSIRAHGHHTCAVAVNGSVYCWGLSASAKTEPALRQMQPIFGLPDAREVVPGGSHDCAITTAGEAWCWGDNDRGQLGDGSMTSSNGHTAVRAGTLNNITALSLGRSHSCALHATSLSCWGSNGGLFGTGDTINRSSPTLAVSGGIIQLDVNGLVSCIQRIDATSACTGSNLYGLLGRGATSASATFQSLVGLSQVSDIQVYGVHSCAIDTSKNAWCWGDNGTGVLGDGSTTPSDVPVRVHGLDNSVEKFAHLTGDTCVPFDDGAAFISTCYTTATMCAQHTSLDWYCWGDNSRGQAGQAGGADDITSPALLNSPVQLNEVHIANGWACGLAMDRDVYCWGRFPGESVDRTPTKIDGLSQIQSITHGLDHMCALTTGGEVFCFGDNANGQLALPL